MLVMESVDKAFPHKTVAHGVSFATPAGSLTAVLGKSGSGKSTLLKMVAGLEQPDAGSVLLNGRVLDGLPPERRQVAMMFQDLALLPHLNVWQNAAFGLTLRGMGKQQAKERALAVLAGLDLQEAAERRIDRLSGGEQQRVALARALAAEPQVLLLDEPFSSLDTGLRGQLQHLVRQAVQRQNIPALLVTHDPAEACLTADQIVLLIDGEIRQRGTPEQVLTRPADADAARLLGCLNVSPERYIPPDALQLAHPQGTLCRIADVFRLPLHNRVHIIHPHYGPLVCFAAADILPHLGSESRVWIDSRRIVEFQAA